MALGKAVVLRRPSLLRSRPPSHDVSSSSSAIVHRHPIQALANESSLHTAAAAIVAASGLTAASGDDGRLMRRTDDSGRRHFATILAR